jgi:hypothetical protein
MRPESDTPGQLLQAEGTGVGTVGIRGALLRIGTVARTACLTDGSGSANLLLHWTRRTVGCGRVGYS